MYMLCLLDIYFSGQTIRLLWDNVSTCNMINKCVLYLSDVIANFQVKPFIFVVIKFDCNSE